MAHDYKKRGMEDFVDVSPATPEELEIAREADYSELDKQDCISGIYAKPDEPEFPKPCLENLTSVEKMALQIGVGRKMFEPDCLYFECKYDLNFCAVSGISSEDGIYVGEGKTIPRTIRIH